MKFYIGVLALLFAAFAQADQITMKDGDRVSGDIVKKDGQTVTVKSKNFGTVTLKWDDIATVKTDQPLNVVLEGGQTVQANIETQGGQIQVATPGTPRTVAPADVLTLRNADEQRRYERYLHPGLLDLWTVTGSIGIAGTKGNAETSTFTTPFNFARVTNDSRTALYFNSIRSSATVNGVNAQTAKAVRGGWNYSHNLSKKVFANAFNDYEYDAFQSLDLRVVLGGGAGYLLWNNEASRLGLVAGGAWNREKFGPTAPAVSFTRNSAEAYWGDDFNYRMNSRTTLAQQFRMFNNLSSGGEYRMNFDVGATTQLRKWLTWSVSLSDRFLSDPVPGRKSNDFLYTTSFGFSWSR
jgi:putative salt-induced outer membrane protein